LERLAGLYGVETGYHDIQGAWHGATDEQLMHVLELLGAPVATQSDVEDALRDREWQLGARVLPPFQVLWESSPSQVSLRLHERAAFGPYRMHVRMEDGRTFDEGGRLEELPVAGRWEVDGRVFVRLNAPLTPRPDFGYHELEVEIGRARARGRLVAAPEQTYAPEGERLWGVFAPTYALRTPSDRGVGHLGHLRRLAERVARAGGHVVGTLPLLATFLDHPYEPSPYVPVSRRFFNELYLELSQLPEIRDPTAAERFGSHDFERVAADLRTSSFVDHGKAYHLIRPVLEACAHAAAHSDVRHEVEAWLDDVAPARNYARFRARTRARRQVWHQWEHGERSGSLPPAGSEEKEEAFLHAYVQFRLDQQLAELGRTLTGNGGGLYLDVPLGVHPDGYDAWADQDVFIDGVSAGAPPDALAPEGQDWGFRPLHPIALQESGHSYVIETIRRQAACAGVLRIDHVMGLHRIFCVPWAFGATGGTYIRQPADDLWAIVCLESHRNRCRVVGEDLGTVPPEVRERMERHRAQRMYVAQFELEPQPEAALRPIPPHASVSVNTHDTPSFMGFWEHRDIVERAERNITHADATQWEHDQRNARHHALIHTLQQRGRLGPEPGPMDVLVGLLSELAESHAPLLLINLEDLWLEPEPQNVPGTKDERPNWCRRMRIDVEQIEQGPELTELFAAIDRLRKADGSG
jgi:4-alpha-glucanotransferase